MGEIERRGRRGNWSGCKINKLLYLRRFKKIIFLHCFSIDNLREPLVFGCHFFSIPNEKEIRILRPVQF